MLIQNSSNAVQLAQPVGLTSNGAPTVSSGNSNVAVNANTVSSAEPSAAQLTSAVNSLNQVMQQSNISLSFSVDATTKIPVVNVTDSADGSVVAQFPSKATLAIAQSIEQLQQRQGLLFNHKA
ncbi:MAG: flagellar protein FlaG [Gallionella sp.]|nr:flagellar protein FlaG [Gallionella sp.]